MKGRLDVMYPVCTIFASESENRLRLLARAPLRKQRATLLHSHSTSEVRRTAFGPQSRAEKLRSVLGTYLRCDLAEDHVELGCHLRLGPEVGIDVDVDNRLQLLDLTNIQTIALRFCTFLLLKLLNDLNLMSVSNFPGPSQNKRLNQNAKINRAACYFFQYRIRASIILFSNCDS